MKTQLIQLSDYNIIVSDEEKAKKGLNFNFSLNKIELFEHNYSEHSTEWNVCRKVIASDNPEHNLPSINYNGLQEEFGIVDVDKLAVDKFGISEHHARNRSAFRKGFKKCQELNDKKFSLEDMLKAFDVKEEANEREEHVFFDKFIQSLQQPKVFNIEIEVEVFTRTVGTSEFDFEEEDYEVPKITSNSIKILSIK